MNIFKSCDSVLLMTGDLHTDTGFYYWTGLSRTRHLSAFLILRNGRKPLVLTDPREYGILKGYRNFETLLFRNANELKALLNKHLGKKVGVDYTNMSMASHARLKKIARRKFVDVSEQLAEARSIKTNAEIRKIAEACKIAQEIIDDVAKTVKAGQSEAAIARRLDLAAMNASEGPSFPTIVAAGRNSATPHHIPGSAKIRSGDIVLIDFGVIYDGYCSDLTRTFVKGNPNVMQKHAYATVYKAQRAAMAVARAGTKASKPFNIANGIIRHAFGSDMVHALGHGLGVMVHDMPSGLHKKADFPLKTGMVVTIEPGYYGPFGVRIEDDVVITRSKPRLLSDAPTVIVSL